VLLDRAWSIRIELIALNTIQKLTRSTWLPRAPVALTIHSPEANEMVHIPVSPRNQVSVDSMTGRLHMLLGDGAERAALGDLKLDLLDVIIDVGSILRCLPDNTTTLLEVDIPHDGHLRRSV
jgi:hypothetical protein